MTDHGFDACPRSKQSPLVLGMGVGVVAWLVLLVGLLLRGRKIAWFSVGYNLPITLAFLGLSAQMAATAHRLGARSFVRHQGTVIMVWALGALLLFLRLVTKSIDISGHMAWAILMGVQSWAQRLPGWFTLFVGAIAIQVLLLKLFYLGGQSGQGGMVAGICLGVAMWFAVRGRRSTGERGVSG